MNDVLVSIHQIVLDDIYIALSDAYERLPEGTMNIKRCLNYLEKVKEYEPPEGYFDEETTEQP